MPKAFAVDRSSSRSWSASPTNAVLHDTVKSWKNVGEPLIDSPAKLVKTRPSTVTDAGHGTFAAGW